MGPSFFYNMTPLSDEIIHIEEGDGKISNLFSNIAPLSDEIYRVDEEFNVSEENDAKDEVKQVKIKFSSPVSLVVGHLANLFHVTPLSDEIYHSDDTSRLSANILSTTLVQLCH